MSMTPTDIEKLKERTKDRAQYLGQGTGCGHVSCAELSSLIAALEAAQANVNLWSDYPTISAKLLDRERAREAEQRACAAALEQVAAKDAEIERLKEYIEEVGGNVERALKEKDAEIGAVEAALKDAWIALRQIGLRFGPTIRLDDCAALARETVDKIDAAVPQTVEAFREAQRGEQP